jgi:imidazolonepropionase-like amidohydrolase
VVNVASQQSSAISPVSHRSILNAVLTPDGAMTYVEGGLLHRMELDEALQPVEAAGPITSELTDMPQFSANGEYVVYLSGDRLKRMHVKSGVLDDVTPRLPYRLDAPSDTYVLRAGRVFTGTGDNYLTDQDIWISGNRIDKIVPRAPDLQSNNDLPDNDVPVIDASDKTVVPGMFEMHAHMGENSETQGRVWLGYGITTVRDPGSNPYIAKERQEAWDSGRRVGPRTHITGYLTDGNRVYYSMAEGIVSEQHLAMALKRTEQLGLDFIKTYVRLPDHWQREVVNFAHGLGIPVSSHELYPAVAHGMDHVEHIGGTSRRGYQPKVSRLGYSYDDVVTLLTAGGMGMTATAVLPGFAVIVAEEPDWFETPQFEAFYGPAMRKSYEMMVPRFGKAATATAKANGRLLRALTDSGALLVTGTDSPFVPYGAGLHAEFRLFARAGVPAADIIRQATIRSAQAAGVDNELGTIEPGKLADMVVLDGDPLADVRDLDNVVMTIKNGRRHSLDQLIAN